MGRGKSQRSVDLIAKAYAILSEIRPASVRAVCYALFVAKIIPSMSKAETNRVSAQLRDARESQMIPWAWIVDETRAPKHVNAWANPAAFVASAVRQYRKDRWAMQPERVEIWSEKATVSGTLAPVLETYGITSRVMHGYSSSTAVYDAAQDSVSDPRPLTVFYVGDWDPSGLHMSNVDLPERLARYGGDITIQRVALTREHIIAGDLPSFSVEDKTRDPRYRWFVERFGRQCWELDALSPVRLRQAVEDAIVEHVDSAAWQQAEAAETAEMASVESILSTWPGISRQAHE